MATLSKSLAPSVLSERGLKLGVGVPPALTTEERLQRIETMGQRIEGYIRFMAQVGTLQGSSAEVKEKAVRVFYDQLLIVEKQLAKLQEEFQLQ